MSPRTQPKSLARVLIALLLLDGGLSQACIHGATGQEQTSTVVGSVRVDRVRVKSNADVLFKIFVGPPGLKIGSTIRGVALSAESAKIHEELAGLASSIAKEGLPTTRGLFSFAGTDVKGTLTELTAAKFPDWASVVSKLKIVEAVREDRLVLTKGTLDKWLLALRAQGRSAYALQIDGGAGSSALLAVQITYPGSGPDTAKEIILDKMLETSSAIETATITWFKDMPNDDLDTAVAGLAATATPAKGAVGSNFLYTLAGVGTADTRSRTWRRYNAKADATTEFSGILWMK